MSKSEKNKVWGLTQEISVVSKESNRKCKRSSDLKKLTYANRQTKDKTVKSKGAGGSKFGIVVV